MSVLLPWLCVQRSFKELSDSLVWCRHLRIISTPVILELTGCRAEFLFLLSAFLTEWRQGRVAKVDEVWEPHLSWLEGEAIRRWSGRSLMILAPT